MIREEQTILLLENYDERFVKPPSSNFELSPAVCRGPTSCLPSRPCAPMRRHLAMERNESGSVSAAH
jgi:hypothetical protein